MAPTATDSAWKASRNDFSVGGFPAITFLPCPVGLLDSTHANARAWSRRGSRDRIAPRCARGKGAHWLLDILSVECGVRRIHNVRLTPERRACGELHAHENGQYVEARTGC